MNSKNTLACSFSYLKPPGEALHRQVSEKDGKKRFPADPFVYVCTHQAGCKAYPHDWTATPNPAQRPQDPTKEMLLCFHLSLENDKPPGGSPPHA